MAKRVSTEAKLLEWVDTAPLDVVVAVTGIAFARVKARLKAERGEQVKAKVVKKPKKVKQAATSFEPQEMAQ